MTICKIAANTHSRSNHKTILQALGLSGSNSLDVDLNILTETKHASLQDDIEYSADMERLRHLNDMGGSCIGLFNCIYL